MAGIFDKMELSESQSKLFTETIEAFPGFSIKQFRVCVCGEIRLTYDNCYFSVYNGIFINGERDGYFVNFMPNNEPAEEGYIQIYNIDEEIIPYLNKWLECIKAETNLNILTYE